MSDKSQKGGGVLNRTAVEFWRAQILEMIFRNNFRNNFGECDKTQKGGGAKQNSC